MPPTGLRFALLAVGFDAEGRWLVVWPSYGGDFYWGSRILARFVSGDGVLDTAFPFALSGQPLAGDFDGDGLDSLCFYDEGTFRCRQLLQPSPQPDLSVSFGGAGATPLMGNVDGR